LEEAGEIVGRSLHMGGGEDRPQQGRLDGSRPKPFSLKQSAGKVKEEMREGAA
jgi:hypothetical protein